jgi:hypothetical protein
MKVKSSRHRQFARPTALYGKVMMSDYFEFGWKRKIASELNVLTQGCDYFFKSRLPKFKPSKMCMFEKESASFIVTQTTADVTACPRIYRFVFFKVALLHDLYS